MNIHTKLIGALDAVILVAAALVTVAFTAALFDPSSDRYADASTATTSSATQTI
jgi:hypothetical protein